jgi:hypothetical protein
MSWYAWFFVGMIIGIITGAWLLLLALRPYIGDDYVIRRAKVKGEGNSLNITQDNKKKPILNRIFKHKKRKNGKS